MAKKDKLDFGRDDWDSGLDFDFDDGFDIPKPPSKKSKPIDHIADGIKSSLKSKFSDSYHIKSMMRKSLPNGFGQAWDTVDQLVNDGNQLYDEATKELKPLLGSLSRKFDQLVPDSAKRTKDFARSLREKFDEPVDNYGQSQQQSIEDQGVQRLMAELEEGRQQADEARNQEARVRDMIDSRVEGKRFAANQRLLGVMANDIRALRQYNTGFDVAYKKKSLELQFRSYAATAAMLKSMNEFQNHSLKFQNALLLNTSLPEYAKTTNTQRWKQVSKEQFFGGINSSLFSGKSRVGLAGDRLKKLAREKISGGKDILEMINDAIEMAIDSKEMGKEMAEMEGKEYSGFKTLGDFLGSIGGDMISDFLSDTVKKLIQKNPKLMKLSFNAGKYGTNPGAALDAIRQAKWYKNMGNSGSEMGMLGQDMLGIFFDLLAPERADMTIKSTSIGKEGEDKLHTQMKVSRSLTEVIPGYLARMLREITIIRTGDAKTPLMMYDTSSESFKSEKTLARDLVSNLKNSVATSTGTVSGKYSDEAKKTYESFKGNAEFDSKTEKEVKLFISRLAREETDVDITGDRLKTTAAFKGLSASAKKAVEEILDKRYTGDTTEIAGSQFTLSAGLAKTRSSVSNLMGQIQAAIREGYGPLLEQQGVIKKNASGDWEVNKEAYYKFFDDDFIGTSDVTVKHNISRSKVDPTRSVKAFKNTKIYDWDYKPGTNYGGPKGYGKQNYTGPMAQDVRSNFGDDAAPGGKQIDFINLNGHVMAAVKKLADMVESMGAGKGVEHLRAIDETSKEILKLIQRDKGSSDTQGAEDLLTNIQRKAGNAGRAVGAYFRSGYNRVRKAASEIDDDKLKELMETLKAEYAKTVAQKDELINKLQSSSEQNTSTIPKGSVPAALGSLLTALLETGTNTVSRTTKAVGAVAMGAGKMASDFWSNNKDDIKEAKQKLVRQVIETTQKAIGFGSDVIFDKLPKFSNFTKGLIGDALNGGKNLLQAVEDLYIPGMDSPVLLGSLISAGFYYDKANNKQLMTMDDIARAKGDIVDGAGVTRAGIVDRAKGLYTASGKPLKTFSSLVLDTVKGAAKMIGGKIFKGYKDLKSAAENVDYNKALGSIKDKATRVRDTVVNKFSNMNMGIGLSDTRVVPILIQIRDLLAIGRSGKAVKEILNRSIDKVSENNGLKKPSSVSDDTVATNPEETNTALLSQIRDAALTGKPQEMINKTTERAKNVKSFFDVPLFGTKLKAWFKKLNPSAAQFDERTGSGLNLDGSPADNSARATGTSNATGGGTGIGGVVNKLTKLYAQGKKTGVALGQASTAELKKRNPALYEKLVKEGAIKPLKENTVDPNKTAAGAAAAAQMGDAVGPAPELVGPKLPEMVGPQLPEGYDPMAGNRPNKGPVWKRKMAVYARGLSRTRVGRMAGKLAGSRGGKMAGKLAGKYKKAGSKIGGILGSIGSVIGSVFGGGGEDQNSNPANRENDQGTNTYTAGDHRERVNQLNGNAKVDAYKRGGKPGDINGDGQRDGGTADRARDAEANRIATEERKKASIEASVKGADAKAARNRPEDDAISKMIGVATKGLSSIASMAGSLFDLAGGLLGGGKLAARLGGGLLKGGLAVGGKLLRGGLALGKGVLGIGRGVAAVGSVVKGVLAAAPGAASVARVGMTAVRAAQVVGLAGGGAGSMVTGAAGVLGSILSSSFVIGAAAIAGVAYGGYKLYKYITRNNIDDFQRIRIMQYGLDGTDATKTYNSKVIALENYMLDGRLAFSGGQPSLNTRAINPDEVRELFDIGKDDTEQAQKFGDWLSQRFTPVFLKHVGSLYRADNKASLKDLGSSSIKDQAKLEYLSGIDISSDIWDKTTSPFKGLDVLSNNPKSSKELIDTQIKLVGKKIQDEAKGKVKAGDTAPKGEAAKAATETIKSAVPDADKTASKDTRTPATNPPGTPKTGYGNKPIPANSHLGRAIAEGDVEDPSKMDKNGSSEGSKSSTLSVGNLKTAPGPLASGEAGMQYVKLGQSANIEGLHPRMKKQFLAMAQEYGEMTGNSISVNSAHRSFQEQEKLFAQYGPGRAARPGASLHEYGLAMDISSKDMDALEQAGLLRKYGFTRPIRGETWHMEPAGLQGAIDRAKKDPGFADQAILASIGRGGGGAGSKATKPVGGRDPALAKALFEQNSETVAKSSEGTEDSATMPAPRIPGMDETTAKALQASGSSSTTTTSSAPADSSSGNNPSATTQPSTGASPSMVADAKAAGLPVPPSGGNGKSMTTLGKEGSVQSSGNYDASASIGNDKHSDVKAQIAKYSAEVGANPHDMMMLAAMESGFNSNAKAKTSSATGMMQFIDSTWDEQLKKHGAKYGLSANTPRNDIRANVILANEYLKQNTKGIAGIKGNVDFTDKYMTHMLGAGGAAQMAKSDPNTLAYRVLPKAAKANQAIFFDGGRPRTVAEVRQALANRIQTKAKQYGINLPDSGTTAVAASDTTPATGSSTPSTGPNGPAAPTGSIATTTANTGVGKEMPNQALYANKTPKKITGYDLPESDVAVATSAMAVAPNRTTVSVPNYAAATTPSTMVKPDTSIQVTAQLFERLTATGDAQIKHLKSMDETMTGKVVPLLERIADGIGGVTAAQQGQSEGSASSPSAPTPGYSKRDTRPKSADSSSFDNRRTV